MNIYDLHPILVFGPSGLGKSTFVELLVQELLKKFPAGAKARITTAEHYKAYRPLYENDLAEVWKVNAKDHPFESTRQAVEGKWPSVVENGIAVADSKVTSPTADTFKQYPIRVYEGVATLGLYLAGSYASGGLSDRIGRGEQLGPSDSSEGPIVLQDGDVSIGKLSRYNFGFIQSVLTGMIQTSQRNGGYVIWTTHEDDVDEKVGSKQAGTLRKTGKTIIGPEGFGQAMTNTMGRDFDDMWRIVAIPQDVEDTTGTRRFIERRLYVKEHIDPTFNVMGKAKNSGAGDAIPDYFRLTDTGERLGMRRMDAAQAVVTKLGL